MNTYLNTGRIYIILIWLVLKCLICGVKNTFKRQSVNQPRAFLLANELPPNAGGGTYRPLSWLTYNERAGFRVTGYARIKEITPSVAGIELLDRLSSMSDIRYYEIDKGRPTSWRFTPSFDGPISALINLINLLEKDAAKENPSVIVASGPNFDNFIAGLYISNKNNIPLVLDFRDEWSICPFDFVKKNLCNRIIERICVRLAKKVIFTTKQHCANYAKLYPQCSHKFIVIPNGWETADFDPSNEKVYPSPSRIQNRISHVGTLSVHTNPESFLNCFQKLVQNSLHKWEVNFVGKVDRKYLLKKKKTPGLYFNTEFSGSIPKKEVANILSQSSILLLLSNDGLQDYIPGKLYDYLASGTPILVYGVYSISSQIVESLDAGIHVNEGDCDGLLIGINRLANSDKKYSDRRKRTEWLAGRTREYLAQQFYDVLNTIINEHQT